MSRRKNKKKIKHRVLWTSRDQKKGQSHQVIVWTGKEKPYRDEETGMYGIKDLASLDFFIFAEEDFQSMFGFLPRRGTCVRYKFMAEMEK